MNNGKFSRGVPPLGREGELYKVVNTFGESFELRYGYYDENDRRWGEPDVIYPDFKKEPLYTNEGEPFTTLIQDACEGFEGRERRGDNTCGECKHFKAGEEWFGICTNASNRKITTEKTEKT